MLNVHDHLVEDAGEHVPYARKHTVIPRSNGKETTVSEVELSQYWSEPDWVTLIDGGLDAEVAARIYTVYHSIRNRPRPHLTHKINGKQWEDAYIRAVDIIRTFCMTATGVDQFEHLNAHLLSISGHTLSDLKGSRTADHLLFWAAGPGGERRLRSVQGGHLRLALLQPWLVKMGWPYSQAVIRTSLVPYKISVNKWRVCRIEGKKLMFADTNTYPSSAEAVQAAKALAEREVEQKQGSIKLIPKRPVLEKEDLIRRGPDFIAPDTNVTPEEVMETFGIRAIQYGNSVSLPDRQRWLNQCFASLCDLADVLGMKRRWIGLSFKGRSLALAIGARGHGHAAAHYETDQKIINQTYRSGVGSLAHEFGHALDHRIGNSMGMNNLVSYVSHCNPLNFGSAPNLHYLSVLSRFHDIIKDSKFKAQAETIASQHRAGKYWTDVSELYARSFEAYVQDKLFSMDRTNPWLVHGTLESDYKAEQIAAHPYPVGEERKVLFQFHEDVLGMLLNNSPRG